MPKVNKACIKWLNSDNPEDVNADYCNQMWPIRQIKGKAEVGNVCQTNYRGQLCHILIVDPPVARQRDKPRLAELGAPPCSQPQEPSTSRVTEEDKDPDYEPDEDLSNSDPDEVLEVEKNQKVVKINEPEGGEDSDTEGTPISEGQRRRRTREPEKWQKNVRKRRYRSGQAYTNEAGKQFPEKAPKPLRHLQACKLDCIQFSEDERQSICSTYWSLADPKRQKDWILANCPNSAAKVHIQDKSHRSCRRQFFLPLNQKSDQKRRVCRQFFCDTLHISYNVVLNAFKHSTEHCTYEHEDQRGKHAPKHALSEEEKNFLINHIQKLPKQESHYCRSATKRLYLLGFTSIRDVWDTYVAACEAENPPVRAVKLAQFERYFSSEFNLGFWKPRKDACATCEVLKQKEDESSKLKLQSHLEMKAECQRAKEQTKNVAKADMEVAMATMDLQAVLQLPHSNVSSFYYSRKLCVYNFTIFDGKSKDGFCFLWSEVEGGRGSSEIATCIYKYLESLGPKKAVYLWSDTCAGQNRNQNLAATIMVAVEKLPIEMVSLNYLETGHTYMECDSMHSCIERSAKVSQIFSLSEWKNVIRRGRLQKPYVVFMMEHDDFFDSKQLAAQLVKNRNRNTEGEVVSWLKIKSLKFEKQSPNKMFYRYDHSSEYNTIEARARGRSAGIQLAKLHETQIAIGKSKKSDLEKLCDKGLIPEIYHNFYRNLRAGGRVRDDAIELSEGEEEDFENAEVGSEAGDGEQGGNSGGQVENEAVGAEGGDGEQGGNSGGQVENEAVGAEGHQSPGSDEEDDEPLSHYYEAVGAEGRQSPGSDEEDDEPLSHYRRN